MLAPFFMKEHGYSVATAGIPLVANGLGRVCSDVMSGVMATYFSPGLLLILAMTLGLMTSIVGYAFIDAMPVFTTAWIVFGLTEAMFALSLRKIGFDQSPPERQGRVQGQMASALGIGFTLGPLLGGWVGKWLGPDGLFLLYAGPQLVGMLLIFCAGAHRYRRTAKAESPRIWREGGLLLRKLPFLASCLAICQSFLFLVGVTRVAFPFLAVNLRGISLETVGTMVSVSRLTDTFGRYTGGWLSDRIKPGRVILLGVALLWASRSIKAKGDNDDQEAGINIVRRALQAPIRQIAENAGVEGSIVVGKVTDQKSPTFGYDAQTDEYGDLIKKGIIDPAKVVRVALQDASSVASLLVTTEAMVAERPKEDSGAPAMPGGGMGGMGY